MSSDASKMVRRVGPRRGVGETCAGGAVGPALAGGIQHQVAGDVVREVHAVPDGAGGGEDLVGVHLVQLVLRVLGGGDPIGAARSG